MNEWMNEFTVQTCSHWSLVRLVRLARVSYLGDVRVLHWTLGSFKCWIFLVEGNYFNHNVFGGDRKTNQKTVDSLLATQFKGQLIYKMSFWCHRFDQNTNQIFLRISALASKERSNQKNKGPLVH